jgi:hypothetical protein
LHLGVVGAAGAGKLVITRGVSLAAAFSVDLFGHGPAGPSARPGLIVLGDVEPGPASAQIGGMLERV